MLDFVHDARLALAETGAAMRATANPIEFRQISEQGRTWALSAQVQAYALAVTIAFLALLLAATALASERDENVIGRLVRGLVSFGQLVWAKVALAALVSLALGAGIALVFGIVIQAGGVEGGEPWERLPLLFAGIALAGASLGALGALLGGLAREARTASLVALLVVLPIVFLGLVPKEVVPAAAWISEAFPFSHAARFFQAALFDSSPWSTVGREALWLVGLAWPTGRSRGARLPGAFWRSAFGVSTFPVTRLRRLRRTDRLRASSARRASTWTTSSCRCSSGRTRTPNPELPAMGRFSIEDLAREADGLAAAGVRAVLLFGIPDEKDEEGSGAYDDDGIVQLALRALRDAHPDLLLLTDVCLCEYTSHGHCGVIRDGEVANDETLELIARTAVSHAEAGADAVCPSDMMDGRVGAIRSALDDAGSTDADRLVRGQVRVRVLRPVPRGGRARPRRSATGAATRWIPPTSARRCASSSSTSPRAPTC